MKLFPANLRPCFIVLDQDILNLMQQNFLGGFRLSKGLIMKLRLSLILHVVWFVRCLPFAI